VCYVCAMDLSALTEGLTGSANIVVGEEHTAPRVGSGLVHVLATPVMINVMEAAALDAIEALLPPGHQSLGTQLNVGHYAATPAGMGLRWTRWSKRPTLTTTRVCVPSPTRSLSSNASTPEFDGANRRRG